MNMPSRALYKFLQEMLSGFKDAFPAVNASNQTNNFSVLSGCDDYLGRLSRLNLESDKFSKTFLISADFSDAFTETPIPRLQESISVIGYILKYQKPVFGLMIALIDYFCKPSGLFSQSKGVPTGSFIMNDIFRALIKPSKFNHMEPILHLYF